MPNASAIDRLSIRDRPRGWPLMYHTWDKLLFLHWPIAAERLRPLIPPRLAIDTYDGTAWIGVVPFTMRGIRPPLAPPLPHVSRCHEINVRTYVHLDGVPGVWFLSLDAARSFIVYSAKASYHLRYFKAAIDLETTDASVRFRSRRTQTGAAPAEFNATWTLGEPLGEARCDSLTFFLTERYCLYASRGQSLYRATIHHRPWPLCRADVTELESTMIASHGLKSPPTKPLAHALAEPLDVEIWPLRRVDARQHAADISTRLALQRGRDATSKHR